MKRIVLAVLALTLLSTTAIAEVTPAFTVQGVLTDNNGVPLPDDDYMATIKIYDAPVGGLVMHSELVEAFQINGVFTSELTNFYEDMLDHDLWLEFTIDGESPMTPRIRLYPAPVAVRASTVDPTNAVTGLNGKHGNVTLVGGNNITLTSTTGIITINADTGAGGDDGDWTISGDDVSHPVGQVYIGNETSGGSKADERPSQRGGKIAKDAGEMARLSVSGDDDAIYAFSGDTDVLTDGHSALFAKRSPYTHNPGSGFKPGEINSAVIGYNEWGDSFTFGMAGYTWFDDPNTGGLLGANTNAGTWAALAFNDETGSRWGMYTPNNLHVGGRTETSALRMPSGAAAGYLMTSDADGNATWSPPAAASSDGDWSFSGSYMYNTGAGAVAIGTAYPHPFADSSSRTTMQISALFTPALALDAVYGGLKRWTMSQSSGSILFSKSTDFASVGIAAAVMDAGKFEVNRFDGDTGIRLQGEGSNESGSKLEIYSTSTGTTLPTAVLDGQDSASRFGGSLTLRNGLGNNVVVATANYNGTGIGRITTPVLEITGGSDLSEQFDIGHSSVLSRPGMVVSIDPDHPGELRLSGESYDRKVAGVISGAGGVNTGMLMGQHGTVADGGHPVALAGRVYVWADASAGPIEPGDLLTTAKRPGHAMKVTDHDLATGAILGKAMTGLKEGQGLILTLVTLQ